ncbi:unnamed protein product [Lactuca virosa]|uniref:Uncharacterized protein n=1 Tax=Lactuca virosa TaxID=75947 RepID=A0AAU9PJ19_9ASTR|nr:unnamed protein product [Lactuca virosa]
MCILCVPYAIGCQLSPFFFFLFCWIVGGWRSWFSFLETDWFQLSPAILDLRSAIGSGDREWRSGPARRNRKQLVKVGVTGDTLSEVAGFGGAGIPGKSTDYGCWWSDYCRLKMFWAVARRRTRMRLVSVLHGLPPARNDQQCSRETYVVGAFLLGASSSWDRPAMETTDD